MLINLSNHPSARWNDKQMKAVTQEFGRVEDIPFPNVPPSATSKEVEAMAGEFFQKIQKLAKKKENQPIIAHVMGEMTFMFRIVKLLQNANIRCVASTTERNTIEHSDGSKTFKFDFVQFRTYS